MNAHPERRWRRARHPSRPAPLAPATDPSEGHRTTAPGRFACSGRQTVTARCGPRLASSGHLSRARAARLGWSPPQPRKEPGGEVGFPGRSARLRSRHQHRGWPDESVICPRRVGRPAARGDDRCEPRADRRPVPGQRGVGVAAPGAAVHIRPVQRRSRRCRSRATRRRPRGRRACGDVEPELIRVAPPPVRDGQGGDHPRQHQSGLPHVRAGVCDETSRGAGC